MTNKKINAYIAKYCGWQNVKGGVGYPPGLVAPGGSLEWIKRQQIPNYCGDLNLMHELVNTLPLSERCEWLTRMDTLTVDPDDKRDQAWFPLRFLRATPRMWAEAFVKTVGGQVKMIKKATNYVI